MRWPRHRHVRKGGLSILMWRAIVRKVRSEAAWQRFIPVMYTVTQPAPCIARHALVSQDRTAHHFGACQYGLVGKGLVVRTKV